MKIIQYSKTCLPENYFANTKERLYLNLRASKGYTGKLEKLKLDDSETMLMINLKAAVTKKLPLLVWDYL